MKTPLSVRKPSSGGTEVAFWLAALEPKIVAYQ